MQTILFQPLWHKPLNSSQRRFGSNLPDYAVDSHPSENHRIQGDRFHLTPLQGRREAMARHLEAGFDLMKAERFAEAIRHFQDAKRLNAMGIGVTSDRRAGGRLGGRLSLPVTVQEAKARVCETAGQNWFFKDSNTIRFANMLAWGLANRAEMVGDDSNKATIFRHLMHENALMAAEENIHACQKLLGQNLTYQPLPGAEPFEPEFSEDDEIDIAATLARYGVPVTRDFMARYPGRGQHVSHPQVWDLVESKGQITRTVAPFISGVDNRKQLFPIVTAPSLPPMISEKECFSSSIAALSRYLDRN